MKELKQKGWILLEWDKEIKNCFELLSRLRATCPSASGVARGGWESLFCCGEERCPACSGNVYRGHERLDLKQQYPDGIAVPIDELLQKIKF